jgi:hypothetical protein
MRTVTKKEIININPNYNFEISFLPDGWEGNALDVLALPISGNEKVWISFRFRLFPTYILRKIAKITDDLLYAKIGLAEGKYALTYDDDEVRYYLLSPLVYEKIKTWDELAEILKNLVEKELESLVSFRDHTPAEIEYAKSLQPLANKYLEESHEETTL